MQASYSYDADVNLHNMDMLWQGRRYCTVHPPANDMEFRQHDFAIRQYIIHPARRSCMKLTGINAIYSKCYVGRRQITVY